MDALSPPWWQVDGAPILWVRFMGEGKSLRHRRAEGQVVRRGSTVDYTECEITEEHGRLVAKPCSTCLAER